jgi:quercetin dioxygenase-like cupin family protein
MKRQPCFKMWLLGMLALTPSIGFGAPCDEYAPGACTEMLLQSSVTWDGAPMKYLKTRQPELTVRTIQFSPRTFNQPHIHEAPVYIYVISGDFQVDLLDNQNRVIESRVWHAGEAFNEVMNTNHLGGNPSPNTWTKLVIMGPSKVGCPFMTAQGVEPVCDDDDHNHDHGRDHHTGH